MTVGWNGRNPPTLNDPKALAIKLTMALARRLLSKDNVQEDTERKKTCGTFCWTWQKYKDEKGYGRISLQNKSLWVHRVYFAAFKKSIPAGKHVDHKCRNPSCCNPDHLRLLKPTKNNRSDVPF